MEKSFVDRVFEHKIGQIVAIVLATIGIISFFNSPARQNEIAISEVKAKVDLNERMENQKETEQSLRLAEIKKTLDDLSEKINQSCEKISAIEAILDLRLPKK